MAYFMLMVFLAIIYSVVLRF
ncbi:protein of unknown function [Thauera humireducens]|nr:protein of unknown function [Thauera humireducens]